MSSSLLSAQTSHTILPPDISLQLFPSHEVGQVIHFPETTIDVGPHPVDVGAHVFSIVTI